MSCGLRGGEKSGVVHAISKYCTLRTEHNVEYGTACATSASGVHNLGGGVRKSGVRIPLLPAASPVVRRGRYSETASAADEVAAEADTADEVAAEVACTAVEIVAKAAPTAVEGVAGGRWPRPGPWGARAWPRTRPRRSRAGPRSRPRWRRSWPRTWPRFWPKLWRKRAEVAKQQHLPHTL